MAAATTTTTELATVFLETTLGTRLVVSFPAAATTVADLKRQVSAEHAACFPRTGPIAVKSLQVKHDGHLFHLADSVPVEGAFRWVNNNNGPWRLLVEVHHELRSSHSLAREDAGRGSRDDSEHNAGGDPGGDGDLAIGDGVPMLHENHQGIECVSNHQLQDDESTVLPRQSSDIYLASGGGVTPPTDQLLQNGVEHALGQQEDGIVKTVLHECSDLYLDAHGSGNPVGMQNKSHNALGQHEDDGNVKTVLQESESDPLAMKQLDKFYEDVHQALSPREDGNVKTMLLESSDLDFAAGDGEYASRHHKNGNAKTMLQESSDLDVAAGECETPLMDRQDKSYEGAKHASEENNDGNVKAMFRGNSDLDVAAGEGVTPSMKAMFQENSCEGVNHASGQNNNGNVKVMFQENSDLDIAAGEGVTPSMNQQDKSHEGVKHTSGQHEHGNVKAVFQENADLDIATGEGETTPMNQLDKSYESAEHASGQPEDGNVKTMTEESSDFDVVTSECETPPMNEQQKSCEDVRYTSGQLDDGTVNVMLQGSSDLDESAAAKGNSPMRGKQKYANAKTRGTELFPKEDKTDKSSIANCDGNISSLASSTVNINLPQETSSDPLAYNQGSCSHSMWKMPYLDQKEPSSNSGGSSDIPPFVQSMNRDKSSNTEMNAQGGNDEEPWLAGLCSGESSFKETDVPHCIKSMTEGNKSPTSNERFLKKRRYEGPTSPISTETESCFTTRKQRVLSVRKVPISKAAKIYGLRC